jgi:cyanate permease
VLVDFAVQSHQVMSQHEIYALRDDARARINTVFMTTVFTGGAISSAAVGALHHRFGWTGACVLGAIFPLIGLAIWAYGRWAGSSGSRSPSAAAGVSVNR